MDKSPADEQDFTVIIKNGCWVIAAMKSHKNVVIHFDNISGYVERMV